MAVFWKLIVLLALAAMPFAMTAATASMSQAPAAATARHCDDHGGQPAEKSMKQSADCAVACSMLMAAETRMDDPPPAIRLPLARPLAELGSGFDPDTATPPPKSA